MDNTNRNEKIPAILKKLQKKGVSITDIIEAALALYVPCDGVDNNKSVREIHRRLEEIIIYQCNDINVQLLLSAAMYLDDEMKMEEKDPVNILSDELIGIAIGEYIGGKKALFNFVRYDMKKPGVLSRLPIFLDDAIGGLIAGCMTKLFEEWK